ncbi:hypothetical protein [Bradyrhizobium sp.]|uniref:hypothetical protein n=1 Tax=Bradyrhizobium sp. TaxID=376 RepID=UPI00239B58A1|nr:hypothetical protein [Bradyrhizobium sp.]MDE1934755.1 hypothetical protein [Bradyrhizobium sp.]MDE2065632.1 hypothetical protein [Bradyrhizobium sp.]
MLAELGEQPARSLFGDFLKGARSAFSRWREARQLDPQEIEEVARDLNISPTELVSLMFAPSESLESLGKRLAYEQLSEEALAVSHADELRDLRRVCSQCSEKTRCARDIRRKRMATPSKYCPNEPTLRLLALEALQEHSAQVLAIPIRLA